jgi:hypothetical protein
MNGNEVSIVRAIRGPITLITVGALFALNNFTEYRFGQTWPVLLIVFGLLSLLRRGTEPAPPAPVNAPPYTYPPASTWSGSYRQSPYQAPQEAPKPPAGEADNPPPTGGSV